MKSLPVITGIICLLSATAFCIGDQHGVFRSQSTQGEAWMGTAVIEKERYNITVFPDYLDVELEWVFRVGGTEPDTFKNALEIVGNLNLVKNSVVTEMITWWKGDILQGKLKTKEDARSQYEEVVDRDAAAPPPPRDPVLLEYSWGEDNYDISIFPVAFGETRRVRIRYLIPAFTVSGINKVLYPHAFTDSAEVSIQCGSGVQSYKVETVNDWKIYTNRDYQLLSTDEYSFKPWGGSGTKRISHIVPVLPGQRKGSQIYLGGFSTPSFTGQMIHVAAMGASEAIEMSGLPEDYVILWRWNHPKILEIHAAQIVEQSKLLKAFLETINGAGKRAALIIDKEGGERITFRLDSHGGSVYKEIVAYLENLAATRVIDPPKSSTRPSYDIALDVEKAQEEFEAAIQAAIALFEANANAIRHLLILTAGPMLIDTYVPVQPIEVDSAISVRLLADVARDKGCDMLVSETASSLYWPGTNPGNLFRDQRLDLTIRATLSNGARSCTLKVHTPDSPELYRAPPAETQKHIYTDRAIQQAIHWQISDNSKVLATFEETPAIISITDGNQYARLIGASKHLTPLADEMPRSMAATLGFIDEKYSLVALEEDKLPSDIATLYEDAGVPHLQSSDIFPATGDLALISGTEWLDSNPPEPIYTYPDGWGWGAKGGLLVNFLVADMVMLEDANLVPRAVDAADGIAFPVADGISDQNVSSYDDFSEALSVRNAANPSSLVGPRAVISNGLLRINLSAFSATDKRGIKVALYDLAGRIIYEWDVSEIASSAELRLSLNQAGLSQGTYVLRVLSQNVRYSEKVFVTAWSAR